jgi:hypothetical protein
LILKLDSHSIEVWFRNLKQPDLFEVEEREDLGLVDAR